MGFVLFGMVDSYTRKKNASVRSLFVVGKVCLEFASYMILALFLCVKIRFSGIETLEKFSLDCKIRNKPFQLLWTSESSAICSEIGSIPCVWIKVIDNAFCYLIHHKSPTEHNNNNIKYVYIVFNAIQSLQMTLTSSAPNDDFSLQIDFADRLYSIHGSFCVCQISVV